MTVEQWRPVVGYEGLYEVSNRGRVRSLRVRHGISDVLRAVPLVLKTRPHPSNGYVYVGLHNGGSQPMKFARVHRLVLIAFRGQPVEGQEVMHLDGTRANNVLENLQWGTHKENKSHQVAHGTLPRGSRHWCSTVTESVVVAIREALARGGTRRLIAEQFSVPYMVVWRIGNRQTWRHL